eukprot:m.617851 g.617851  ORF g.617851 m.617851 type:complete len:84 (-) comp22522_c2_seq2:250-501(-)
MVYSEVVLDSVAANTASDKLFIVRILLPSPLHSNTAAVVDDTFGEMIMKIVAATCHRDRGPKVSLGFFGFTIVSEHSILIIFR